MEAICKPDFERRVRLNKEGEDEKHKLKKLSDDAELARRKSSLKTDLIHNRLENSSVSLLEKSRPVKEIIVPTIGFHDFYGVWFYGHLTKNILQIIKERFENELKMMKYVAEIRLENMMHVYIDVNPKMLKDGIYEVSVYGTVCRLYKWMAQGFERGLVVHVEDQLANQKAAIYMESGTWSWMLNDSFRQRLDAIK